MVVARVLVPSEYSMLDTVKLVLLALVSVVCPATVRAPERVASPETFNTLEYSMPDTVSLVLLALTNVLCPCTLILPVTVVEAAERLVTVPLMMVALVDMILVLEAVLAYNILDTVRFVVLALLSVAVEVEVSDPTVRDPPVAESKNSEDRYAVVAFNILEKRLVEVELVLLKLVAVALVANRLVIHELVEVD